MSDFLQKNEPDYEKLNLEKEINGRDLAYAPRPALPAVTAANNTTFPTGTGAGGTYITNAATTILDNMRTRISDLDAKLNALEANLIKLGLNKHR